MIRARCKTANWNEGMKDPSLTTGKFYPVLQKIQIMNNDDPWITVVGDDGIEITRPKGIFAIFEKDTPVKIARNKAQKQLERIVNKRKFTYSVKKI
jgi:hypothetical protein